MIGAASLRSLSGHRLEHFFFGCCPPRKHRLGSALRPVARRRHRQIEPC